MDVKVTRQLEWTEYKRSSSNLIFRCAPSKEKQKTGPDITLKWEVERKRTFRFFFLMSEEDRHWMTLSEGFDLLV